MTGARRGNAALETALVLPVLLVLLFAIVDWSWFLMEWMTVTRAASQGVRVATGLTLEQDPVGRATAEAGTWLARGLASGPAVVDTSLVPSADGTVLRVRIDAPFDPPIDLFWTPPNVVAQAEGLWYGDRFE